MQVDTVKVALNLKCKVWQKCYCSQSYCSSVMFLLFPCLSLGLRGSLLIYVDGNWHKSRLDQHGDRKVFLLLVAATYFGIIMLSDGQGQFNRIGLQLREK